ncbi:hypothetical protein D3C87_2018080 [compost metagenome]
METFHIVIQPDNTQIPYTQIAAEPLAGSTEICVRKQGQRRIGLFHGRLADPLQYGLLRGSFFNSGFLQKTHS